MDTLKKANASSKVAPPIKPDIEEALLIADPKNFQLAQEVFKSTTSENVRLVAFITLTNGTLDSVATPIIGQSLKSENPELRHAALIQAIAMNLPSLQSGLAEAVVFRQIPGANEMLIEIISGTDEPASKEAMKALYFTATIDDLRNLCAKAITIQDAEQRKPIASICSKIATRIDTDAARELVKPLR